jgi:GAF domain-containing protein
MEFDRQLADMLGEFARTLGTNFPIQSILDHLVARIVSMLPIAAARIAFVSPDASAGHSSASDPSALHFARLQAEVCEGPGVTAGKTGKVIVVSDLRTDDRFPNFAPRALSSGLMSAFAFPLRRSDSQLGTLELYRNVAGPLEAGAMIAAQTLADVAAAYLINARPAPAAARSHLAVVQQPSRS